MMLVVASIHGIDAAGQISVAVHQPPQLHKGAHDGDVELHAARSARWKTWPHLAPECIGWRSPDVFGCFAQGGGGALRHDGVGCSDAAVARNALSHLVSTRQSYDQNLGRCSQSYGTENFHCSGNLMHACIKKRPSRARTI